MKTTQLITVAAFATFLFVRIVAWVWRPAIFPIYGDQGYYINAGTLYIMGTLPNAVNSEHPPFAKYIIGLFAVHLGLPGLASELFGFLLAIVSFLLVRKLTGSSVWGAVAVWLQSFDFVTISASMYPVLEVFMTFFAITAVFVVLVADKWWHYGVAGVLFGLAVASKWTAVFWLLPVLLWLLFSRNSRATLLVLGLSLLGYAGAYVPLIAAEGVWSFLTLQLWMASFMFRSHGPTWGKLLYPFIFELTTWGRVQGYNQGFHPEAVRVFGQNYISFADQTNPLITLFTIPVLYYLGRRFVEKREPKISLFFMLLVGTQVWMLLFGNAIELWFYAPLTALLTVCIPLLLAGNLRRNLTYLYLALVALWPLFAYSIILLRLYSILL